MSNTVKNVILLAMCVIMILAVGGCCKCKRAEPKPPETAKAPEPKLSSEPPTIIDPAADLGRVYFDYDKSSLRPDAIDVLNGDAAKIKNYPADLKVLIEGHCDERGTQEYNLALGERRALAVREYLIKSGIAGDKLFTISYGKEKPANEGHAEDAWKLNRRAQFNKGK